MSLCDKHLVLARAYQVESLGQDVIVRACLKPGLLTCFGVHLPFVHDRVSCAVSRQQTDIIVAGMEQVNP